jgi:hypothetical protein
MRGAGIERDNRRLGLWLVSAMAFLYLAAIVGVILLN